MASNLILLTLSLCVATALCVQVDAQFFTKTSKNIPRMGRRSGDDTLMSKQNRRLLIEGLIDEYGPNLLEALEAKANNEDNQQLSGINNEYASQNDQPLESIRVSSPYDEADNNGEVLSMQREARSSVAVAGRGQQQPKDSSLAMRALHINRYMQHLASGQPLMPYDKLLSGDRRTSSINIGQKYDK